mgnify:CR=1 FL=1
MGGRCSHRRKDTTIEREDDWEVIDSPQPSREVRTVSTQTFVSYTWGRSQPRFTLRDSAIDLVIAEVPQTVLLATEVRQRTVAVQSPTTHPAGDGPFRPLAARDWGVSSIQLHTS